MEPQETDYNEAWHMYNKAISSESDMDKLTNSSISVSTGEGLWSQVVNSNTYKSPYYKLEERLDKLELDNKLLRLKILSLEGKFNNDEVNNIRKMLMSEDEASKTLADSIIENA